MNIKEEIPYNLILADGLLRTEADIFLLVYPIGQWQEKTNKNHLEKH